MKHMERRGVRDLKVNASAVLALVKAGETVEITERGKPVARIVPLPRTSTFDQWVAAGLVSEATGDLLDIQPLDNPAGGSPLTDALLEMRRGDTR